jgi:hypothetical protein
VRPSKADLALVSAFTAAMGAACRGRVVTGEKVRPNLAKLGKQLNLRLRKRFRLEEKRADADFVPLVGGKQRRVARAKAPPGSCRARLPMPCGAKWKFQTSAGRLHVRAVRF